MRSWGPRNVVLYISRSFIFLFEFISLSVAVKRNLGWWGFYPPVSPRKTAKSPSHARFLPVPPHPEKVPPKSSHQSFANQWIFKMAASMVKVVHQLNFCRFLRPALRLGQFYSTESSPSVVGKQDKALEVVEDEAKVKKRVNTFCLYKTYLRFKVKYHCSPLVKFI